MAEFKKVAEISNCHQVGKNHYRRKQNPSFKFEREIYAIGGPRPHKGLSLAQGKIGK